MAAVGTISTPVKTRVSAGFEKAAMQYRMTLTTDDSTGAVSGINVALSSGKIVAVTVVPSGGGTQPTDLFDVTLLDADSLDLLGGGGANLSNAGPTCLNFAAAPIYFPGGNVQPTVANGGNSKAAELVILVEG